MTRVETRATRRAAAFALALLLPASAHAGPAVCGGTVAVAAKGRTVEVKGDDERNCIDVVAQAGQLIVTPSSGATVVTGSPASMDGVSRILIVLKDGDDQVLVQSDMTDLSAVDVKANLGDDADRARLESLEVRRISVNAGKGDDFVSLGGSTVDAKSVVNGGKDSDSYEIELTTTGPIDVKAFEAYVRE